jgi:hypothetical protein
VLINILVYDFSLSVSLRVIGYREFNLSPNCYKHIIAYSLRLSSTYYKRTMSRDHIMLGLT